MTIKFVGPGTTKHGRLELLPNVPLAFADPSVEEYFKAAGWAEDTVEAPAYTYPAGSIEVDSETRFGSGPKAGSLVLEANNLEAPVP